MSYSHILFQVEEPGIALLTVNRPEKLNALSGELIAELADAFGRVAGEPAIRAAILTGAGEKAFVAGADIREWTAGSARGNGRTGPSRMDLRRTCCGEWLRIRKAGSGWGLPRTSAWSILSEDWSKYGQQAAQQSGIGSSRWRPIARGAFGWEQRAEVWQDWIPKHQPFRDLGRRREYT